MPTRLLRDGIIHSQRVDMLDAPAEVFYRRLMSAVDDHGLFDGRPAIVRSALYPLRIDRVREADIRRWIAECEKAALVVPYTVNGKPYLKMLDTKWVARSSPKYPPPNPEWLANKCKQLFTTANLFGDVVGDGDVVVVGNPPPLAETPTLQEFQKHADGLCIPPPVVEACFHYYAAAGWMRGNTRLSNYKALLQSWWTRERQNPKRQQAERPRMAI